MTTYVKPGNHHHKYVMSSPYQDFDIENGTNKRISCLLAVTVLALVIALAALSIGIMLLLQVHKTDDMGISSVSVLEQRVQELETKIGMNTSVQMSAEEKRPVDPEMLTTPPLAERPILPQHLPEEKDHEVVYQTTSPKPLRKATTSKPVAPAQVPSTSKPTNPGITNGSNEDDTENHPPRLPGYDDDEDNEGSGDDDCPVQPPRPICPIGFGICLTKQRCPVPVCC